MLIGRLVLGVLGDDLLDLLALARDGAVQVTAVYGQVWACEHQDAQDEGDAGGQDDGPQNVLDGAALPRDTSQPSQRRRWRCCALPACSHTKLTGSPGPDSRRNIRRVRQQQACWRCAWLYLRR